MYCIKSTPIFFSTILHKPQRYSSLTITHLYIVKILLAFAALSFLTAESHVINFRSTNLYPESFTWNHESNNFIASSLRNPILVSISQTAVVDTLISDDSLPVNSTCFLGVSIDPLRSRILAIVHSHSPSAPFSALAAYDLQSHRRIFLTELPDPGSTNTAAGANDVTIDPHGNAYITNSASNFIWIVNVKGEHSVFSKSPAFTAHPVERGTVYSSCGLNGIVHVSEGYLLVVQSNTGKLFKINSQDGTAETVKLNKELTGGDGVAVRSDGVVLVVSQHKLYLLKSDSSWRDGVVYDEISLDGDRFASSVAIGIRRGQEMVYVLYGHIIEGLMGNVERDEFGIVEVNKNTSEQGYIAWLIMLMIVGFAFLYYFKL